MTSVKSPGCLTVGTVAVRRKPALTYQSPSQNTITAHPEQPFITTLTTRNATLSPPTPPSPTTQVSQFPEPSHRSTSTHKSSRHHMITPLLPLYHPFGPLALSLPDLDPTAFGLPAPVAVFDDPTRRSNRQRRPAAKVRDTDEPTLPQPASSVAVAPTLEPEVRERTYRRRRGGGPGGKRKRREVEDGDATYPVKRPRNPRSLGVASGTPGTRAISREEEGSPTLSNAHSRASPALEAGRGEVAEEKKPGPERRTTRSRRAIARQDSTASEDTSTSASPSVSATNTAVPQVVSSGDSMEADEPGAREVPNEANVAPGDESKKAEPDKPVPEQQEN